MGGRDPSKKEGEEEERERAESGYIWERRRGSRRGSCDGGDGELFHARRMSI